MTYFPVRSLLGNHGVKRFRITAQCDAHRDRKQLQTPRARIVSRHEPGRQLKVPRVFSTKTDEHLRNNTNVHEVIRTFTTKQEHREARPIIPIVACSDITRKHPQLFLGTTGVGKIFPWGEIVELSKGCQNDFSRGNKSSKIFG